ncbi:hypothetical protein EOL94_02650 [bacterium]|nr:hypothetical protein [bacterium]
MDLKIKKNSNGERNINEVQFLRSLGWAQIYDRKRDKISYVKRLGPDFYPRLHMYFSETDNQYIFSMHLDQKKASYTGHHAHSGEYDNELVKKELDRIQKNLNNIGIGLNYGKNIKEDSKISNKKEYSEGLNRGLKDQDGSFFSKNQNEQVGFGELDDDLDRMKKFKKRKKCWFKKIFKL